MKKQTIIAFAVGAAIGFSLIAALKNALDLPEVHFSASTYDCVRVVKFENSRRVEHDCEELPERYVKIWVP